MRATTLIIAAAGALLSVTSIGCGGASDGPARHALSGQVTYGGKPVPAGEIAFEPDSTQGNTGPATIALIKDGRYETPADKGAIGGQLIVRISGFDGKPYSVGAMEFERGKELFPPYETTLNLAEGVSTQDFEVPAAAAK